MEFGRGGGHEPGLGSQEDSRSQREDSCISVSDLSRTITDRPAIPNLGSPDVLGLQLPEAFIPSCAGQGFWEWQSRNIWRLKVGNNSSQTTYRGQTEHRASQQIIFAIRCRKTGRRKGPPLVQTRAPSTLPRERMGLGLSLIHI